MPDTVPDHADPHRATGVAPFNSPQAIGTEDPARQVGEVFRRLSGCHATYGEAGLSRIVASVLVALGRAALEEAERQARHLRERSAPSPRGIMASATARRVDFDAWDPGDRD